MVYRDAAPSADPVDAALFETTAARDALFERYLDGVLANRTSDPLVVLVDKQLGDPDFHQQVKLFVAALKIEGRAFTVEAHAGLRQALEDLLAQAALIARSIR